MMVGDSKIDRICKICRKDFKVWPYLVRQGFGKYCSRKCSSIGHKEIKWTKKQREIILSKRSGRPNFRKHTMGRHKSGGYYVLYKPKHPFCNCRKNVLEHRYIVEKFIKRFLKKIEEVHHVNENKSDNNINNLMLFTSKSAHMRFHNNPNNVKKSEIIFDGRKINQSTLPLK